MKCRYKITLSTNTRDYWFGTFDRFGYNPKWERHNVWFDVNTLQLKVFDIVFTPENTDQMCKEWTCECGKFTPQITCCDSCVEPLCQTCYKTAKQLYNSYNCVLCKSCRIYEQEKEELKENVMYEIDL